MKPVWITGTGAVGPLGIGIPASLQATRRTSEPRRVPADLALKRDFPGASLRWLDDASLWWAHAVKQAVARTPDERRVSIGQFSGQTWGPTQPVIDLERTLLNEGFSAMNPAAFPFSVGNAPAAQASLLVHVAGPAITLNGKEACGLAAIVEACRFLDAGLLTSCVAGGADQLAPFLLKLLKPLRGPTALPSGEGAYAVSLESGRDRPAHALARITGWASLSSLCPPHVYPGNPESLFDRLLERITDRAGLEPSVIERVVLPEDTKRLQDASSTWREARVPGARQIRFQSSLGVCGAAWAGAAGSAARAHGEAKEGPTLLLAFSTGGAGCGVLMEDARA